MDEAVPRNPTRLVDLSNDVLGLIFRFLSATELTFFWASASKFLQMRMLMPTVVKEVRIIMHCAASWRFSPRSKIFQPGLCATYFSPTMRVPPLIYALPTLTSFIMCEPRPYAGYDVSIGFKEISLLPPTLTHLEMMIPNPSHVFWRTIETRETEWLNVGVKFPSLKSLIVGKNDASWRPICIRGKEAPLILASLPQGLHTLRAELAFVLADDALLALLPKTLTDIAVNADIRLNAYERHRTPSNLPMPKIDIFNLLPDLAHVSLLSLEILKYPELPPLTSLSLEYLPFEKIHLLPKTLTKLRANCRSPRWAEPARRNAAAYLHNEYHWATLIRALPRTLNHLQLHGITSFQSPDSEVASATPLSGVLTQADFLQLPETERRIFPPQLRYLDLGFRHLSPAYRTTEHSKSPPSEVSWFFPNEILELRLEVAGVGGPKLLTLPQTITSLEWANQILFTNDMWSLLPNIRKLALKKSRITEDAVLSENVPATLSHLTVWSVELYGWSFQRSDKLYQKLQHRDVTDAFNNLKKKFFFHLKASPNYYVVRPLLCLPKHVTDIAWDRLSLSPALIEQTIGSTCNLPSSSSIGESPFFTAILGKTHFPIGLSSSFVPSTLPPGLTALKIRRITIPYAYLSHLPKSLSVISGGTVAVTWKTEGRPLLKHLELKEHVHIPKSFGAALSVQFAPLSVNCAIQFDETLGDDILQTLSEKMTFLEIAAGTNISLASLRGKFPVLTKLHFDYAPIEDPQSGWAELDISAIPRSVAELHLTIGSSNLTKGSTDHSSAAFTPSRPIAEQAALQNGQWPPSLTALTITSSRPFDCLAPTASASSLTALKTLQMKGQITRIENEDIKLVPRSVTSLRLDTYSLNNSCLPYLPPDLKHIKVLGAIPDKHQVMDYIESKRGTKGTK